MGKDGGRGDAVHVDLTGTGRFLKVQEDPLTS